MASDWLRTGGSIYDLLQSQGSHHVILHILYHISYIYIDISTYSSSHNGEEDEESNNLCSFRAAASFSVFASEACSADQHRPPRRAQPLFELPKHELPAMQGSKECLFANHAEHISSLQPSFECVHTPFLE